MSNFESLVAIDINGKTLASIQFYVHSSKLFLGAYAPYTTPASFKILVITMKMVNYKLLIVFNFL